MLVTKYISTQQNGKEFITHDDQEIDGLRFEIVVSQDVTHYVKVTGEDDKVTAWQIRVNGTEVSESQVQAIIDSLPPTLEERMELRIQLIEKALDDIILNGGGSV